VQIEDIEMSFATFSGPLRSGTERYGAGRNTGLVLLGQSTPVVFGTLTGTAFVLPAGAQLINVTFQTTTVFSAATTAKLTIGATDITGTITVTSLGVASLTFAATSGAMALVNNVGATDATVTYTLAGAGLTTGAGNIVIEYMQRAPDGAANPTTFQN
jgi:hypothetical protein